MPVIGLFIFSLSSWFILGRLYLSKDWSISSRLSILLAYSFFVVVSYGPLYFCDVSSNFFYIPDFTDLGPLPFFLDESC